MPRRVPDRSTIKINILMARATRTIGLRLCFHDKFHRSNLTNEWTTHPSNACTAFKGINNINGPLCLQFDANETHTALAGQPEG
ncbi:MAG: hypothetical protein JXR97_09895, partial [Planctomycetes bacterium]|nr:hypothetical protein [Planctomycetota bacterium]